MSSIPFHKRIGVRILFTLIGIAVFSVLLTAITHYVLASAVMRSNVAERNLQIARQAAGEIELYLDDAFRNVHAVAQTIAPIRDPWLRDAILENTIVLLDKYRVAHLLDANGEVLASSELDNSKVHYDANLYDDIFASPGLYVSDVRLTQENLPILTIAEPVHLSDHTAEDLYEELYIEENRSYSRDVRFITELDLRTVWELIDDISFGKHVKAYLVAPDHQLIAHPDKTRILTFFETDYLPDSKDGWSESAYTGISESGKALLVATAPTDTLDWHLVIEQPLEEAYMPIHTTLLLLAGIALLVLAAATAASLYLAKTYAQPLYRVLEGTYHIGRGDLKYRLAVNTEDEIGRLSHGFNEMVDDLERRTIELEQSEEKYRLLTENVNDIIFLTDREGTILHLNRQATSLAGGDDTSNANTAIIKALSDKVRTTAESISGNADNVRYSAGDIGSHNDTQFEVELNVDDNTSIVLEVKLVVTEDQKYGTLYYGVARDITERKAAEKKLQEYQTQLRSLASQLSLTEARERQKIASQIHDRIGQALALTRIHLGGLAGSALTEEGNQTIRTTMELIEQIIQDTRSLIFSVSSPLLYEVGLGAALEQLVEQFQSSHEMEFGYDNGDKPTDLDVDISVLLFDSVRELMVNVVKHAHADRCVVSMNAGAEEIQVSVTDNGIGMNGTPGAVSMSDEGGFGLFSIRERLNHLGGTLTISTEKGTGTTVILTAPRGTT